MTDKANLLATAAAFIATGLFAPAQAGGENDSAGGPDVTVLNLVSVSHFGEDDGIHAYAVGLAVCNVGDQPLWWCGTQRPYCDDDQHPVIAQNLYRLRDGRFEQLGMSWLPHDYHPINAFDPACGDCTVPPHISDQVGAGCTSVRSSGYTGARPLGLRSEVDAAAGTFPFPYTAVSFSGAIDQRLQVEESDLDPILNPGARFWIEGHYVAADDAQAGNAGNNASYREVVVQPGTFNLSTTGDTVREQPALYAWQAIDPAVEIVAVDVPGAGMQERFHVARRVTVGAGKTHVELALHNLDADRSARSFSVRFLPSTLITGVGFRDVDHHSGEPYSTTDWTIDVDAGTVTWSTDDFDTDPEANALRWGTMFSFWFDADADARGAVYALGLFKPGSPMEIEIPFAGDTIFADGFESGDISAWAPGG